MQCKLAKYLQNTVILWMCIFSIATISATETPPQKSEVVIPLNYWSSQRVLSRLVGTLIARNNTPVSYLNISSDEQWGALQRGLIHFQLEIWQPSMGREFNQFVARGEILDVGTHDARVIEEWWYPEYVKDVCPELPNWESLNRCAALFSKTKQSNKGLYFTGPWYYSDAHIIRALHLNFTLERKPDGMSLWQELKAAHSENRPILLLNWSPNWTDIEIKGQFVEFPAFTPECETDPTWGLNPELTNDCGNIRNGWLKKAATPSLPRTHPCVYQFIKRVSFSHDMVAYAAYLLVAKALSEEDAVEVMLEKYEDEINKWQPNAC